nr:helix-turn-helix domain-containing protein [Cryobacterium sp. Y62]
MTDSKIASAIKLLEAGMTPPEVARDLGMSIPTLYQWVPANGTS